MANHPNRSTAVARRKAIRASDFQGYGHAFREPSVGDHIDVMDANEKCHSLKVVELGAHWSNSGSGSSGRWVFVELPEGFEE